MNIMNLNKIKNYNLKKSLKKFIPNLFIKNIRLKTNQFQEYLKTFLFRKKIGIKIWQFTWALSLLKDKSFRELFFTTKKDDICLDIGSIIFWLRGAKKIFCIEPHPLAFKRLKKNLSFIKNISFHNIAISENSGKEKLFLCSELKNQNNEFESLKLSRSSSIVKDKINNGSLFYETITLSLYDFISQINKTPNLIKCDIEGGEYLIYHQFLELAKSNKVRLLLIETHVNKLQKWNKEHNSFIKGIKKSKLEKKFNIQWH